LREKLKIVRSEQVASHGSRESDDWAKILGRKERKEEARKER
jgi:hypothetical protein